MPNAAETNAWERYVTQGRLWRESTQKQVETFVKRLVRQGEVASEDASKVVEGIQDRSRKTVKDFQTTVRRIVREEVGDNSAAEIKRLQGKVEELEKALAVAKKPAAKPAAKKTTTRKTTAAKKPAAKKAATTSKTAAKSTTARKTAAAKKTTAAKKPAAKKTTSRSTAAKKSTTTKSSTAAKKTTTTRKSAAAKK